jgi:ubiquinone/menaquinone biosynthesis C-methylase UbiE
MPLERVLEPEVMDDPEEAQEYDAMDFSETDRLLVERAAELAGSSELIVDLGCGNGKITVALQSRLSGRVCGVDMSQEMLALAAGHRRTARSALHLIVGDSKRLPFPDGSIGMVVSNSLIHHVPHTEDVFREIARILRRSGALLIRDLVRPESTEDLEAIAQRYGSGWSPRQQRLFADSLRAGLRLDEVRRMLDDSGLGDVQLSQISDRHWSAERECGDRLPT